MSAKLKFPVIKGSGPKDRHLNMDDYLEFIMFNLRHVVDVAAGRKAKRGMFAGKPFQMR